MCFSATGSFFASGLLAGIGVVAICATDSIPHRMFAATPLLFSAQQAAEGVVWLTIDRPEYASVLRIAANVFLVFALVVWPLWMPSSLQRVERDPERRRLLRVLLGIGTVVSACAGMLLMEWQPAASVVGNSICYDYSAGPWRYSPPFYLLAYAIPTIVPFFVSSARLALVTGIALIGSLIATVIIERNALTSVWCFFAAILSGLILTAVVLEQRASLAGPSPRVLQP